MFFFIRIILFLLVFLELLLHGLFFSALLLAISSRAIERFFKRDLNKR